MSTAFDSFLERRSPSQSGPADLHERRQFANGYAGLSVEAQQLAIAIDSYKLRHRRRYIDYEEILAIIKALGYRQSRQVSAELDGE